MAVPLLALVLGVMVALPPAPTVTIVAEARAIQPGELVVLTVTTSEPVDGVRGEAFARPLAAYRITETRWRALVGIDLAVKPGAHTISIAAGPTSAPVRATHRLVVRVKQFPTRRLTVSPDYVDPPATVLARIEAEARQLAEMWAGSGDTPLWRGAFTAPVPERANSAFGSRSIFNGQPRSPHGGADFPSPAGTPVRAPNAGRIVLARDLYYTGQTVAVDHGLGLISLFAHLQALGVAEGASVEGGQVLGQVGSTGRVTGAHLHWTVRANGARIDPLSLLAVLGPGTSAAR
jgi:murein DD-endopeptidase MepM/ murein hydrolase activator NlpD